MSGEGTEWQNIKTLGALLGEENDVKPRMQLAELAFRRMFGLFAGVGASLVLKGLGFGIPWDAQSYCMGVEPGASQQC